MFVATAAPAIVHVDQVSAVRAGMRSDLPAQKRLRADLTQPRGIRGKIDAVAVKVSLLKRLHTLARPLRARRAREQPTLRNTRTHDALAPVLVRLAEPCAATGARVLAKVPVAEHAV